MHDVYFCPLKSAGKARLDIPRLPSHRFPCEILGKLCWEIPSRLFVKLMVNCCWFGSVGGLGCEGGCPEKNNSPLRHGGISGIQTTKPKPTLKPLAEFGSKKNGSNRIEFSKHPNKHGPCLFSPCGFTVHVPNNGSFGNQSFLPT